MGMWRAIGMVVGVILLVVVEMGLSLWWWIETSPGVWDWKPAKYVMQFGWGMAPIMVWAVSFFLVLAIGYDREGRPRWR